MDRIPVTQKLPFSRRTLSKKAVLSYIFDYAIIFILGAIFTAIDKVEPYHQEFSLSNYTLHYKYAVHERIPVPFLLVLVVIIPAIIISVYTLIIDGIFSHHIAKRKRYRLKDRLWELNCGLLGLLLAIGASFVVTGALKNAIGKPRPDLIDRCQPNVQADPPNLKLSNHSICTQTDNNILKDGFRSFPSGHSSSAFAGLFYISLYLAGKMHVLDSKGEVWKAFIVLIPTLGAALIAGSRIMDARHHPFDVLSGSTLGILVAWASYRQYFPSISDYTAKGRAYPIRSWGRDPSQQPQEVFYPMPVPQDEEQGKAELVSGRHSPPSEAGGDSGNAFRSEISSQRQRRQPSLMRGPSSAYSVDPSRVGSPPVPPLPSSYNPQQPGYIPYSTRPVARASPQNDWVESDDEPDSDLELQPQYTLSNPSPGDPLFRQGSLTGQDTAYRPQPAPLERLKSVKAQGAQGVPSAVAENSEYSESDAPPPPPQHGDGMRRVQLAESYAPR
ncbi:acid phosphatase/Vanadium-dependent haloperoxidase [Trichodelitschia bisporula]|uniref:Acid phosphatase/Vanadium-dependent haloperoxidase n=1 Tax=Trichodelitschia bisporula TaxID=703511 RepID=A0A6G1I3K5_9PEZI|nr:acid phosphatase/Vanadium-dependent haloperoxidase [Trichodelitschia bisporula]